MRTTTGAIERPLVSVVAPCFNEEEGLREFHRRVAASCSAAAGESYEIVLINDGSRDGTWTLIADLSREDPHVVGINLSRNHGHQIALTAGLSQARGERIFILDADLQDPPELLTAMMAEMDSGADVVYGRRRSRKGESWFKLATASAFYRCLHALTDVDIPLDTGDFRLMSRRAVKALMRMPEQHRFIRGMVTWLGFRQVAIDYDRDERLAGETHYPLHRMVRLAFDAITGFSIQPLRAASLFGMTVGLAGLAMLMRSLYVWFTHETVPGWTSLITVVLLLGSVQLLFLGVLGEYVGRLFMESKRRPLFIISDVVGRENAARAWRRIARSPGSGLVAMHRAAVNQPEESAVSVNARKAG
jgi:polyisoprenyl-phosphate glycosyltransferase